VGLIALVAAGKLLHSTFLTPPLAATAVIIAGAPATPPAQPRSVLGGHLLSALLGICIVPLLGVSQWTIALAGGVSLSVMALARAVHAPAAATAALIVAQHPSVPRTLTSLVVGCCLLILIGCAAGLLVRHARYPRYWW
jgi:CBS-domain-containing membrane protein